MASGPEPRPGRLYRFGPFELSAQDAELRKKGVRIRLQEQPFQVLVELVGNAGHIVTREQLQQKLWPADTFVDFDIGLNSTVRKLRQALGDDAEEPRYIETLAKRGYRFIAPVHEVQPQIAVDHALPAQTVLQESPRPESKEILLQPGYVRGRRPDLAFIIVGLVAVALAIFAFLRTDSKTSHLLVEQRITSNPEEDPVEGAVLSPEGKYVAYSDSTGVYFREIATGETHPLPLPAGQEWAPTSWYPDGIHLLLSPHDPFVGPEFLTPQSNDIWRASILGGALQRVVESASSGVVSPDGSHIAFLRGNRREDRNQIWIAGGIGESDPRQISLPPAQHPILSTLVWSPHGRRIAYLRLQRFTGSLADLWAIETVDRTTGATKLAKVSPHLTIGLAWNPDGRLLYECDTGAAGKPLVFGVFALRVDENTGEPQGKEEQLSTGNGFVDGISVDRTGKRLIAWRHGSTPSVYVGDIHPTTGQFTRLRRLTLDQNQNLATVVDTRQYFGRARFEPQRNF